LFLIITSCCVKIGCIQVTSSDGTDMGSFQCASGANLRMEFLRRGLPMVRALFCLKGLVKKKFLIKGLLVFLNSTEAAVPLDLLTHFTKIYIPFVM